MGARFILFVVLAASLLGCTDPVHDQAVAALGPEDPGVRRGPLHRPGQPCLVCHGGLGPSGTVFTVAGTVFIVGGAKDPLPGAAVAITDTSMPERTFQTNCAGNFFVTAPDYDPIFPLQTHVDYGGVDIKMKSHIGRDGSCGSCHSGIINNSAVDRVYLVDQGETPPNVTSNCR